MIVKIPVKNKKYYGLMKVAWAWQKNSYQKKICLVSRTTPFNSPASGGHWVANYNLI